MATVVAVAERHTVLLMLPFGPVSLLSWFRIIVSM